MCIRDRFFNGEDGIEADRVTGVDYFGISYGPHIEVYYLILFWCFLCVFLMYFLTKTPFGKMCNAVRDNAQRAQFIGYNIRKVRWPPYFPNIITYKLCSLRIISYSIAHFSKRCFR